MSYAKPKPINPAVKYIDWKGDEGKFVYYEKSSEKNIEIPLPVKFLVVDELSVITGFNDANQTGVYSNEVRNITKQNLFVQLFSKNGKSFNGYGIQGLYKDIRGDIKSLGGKFAKSVYAMTTLDGKVELVNFKIKGAFLNAWIEKKVNADAEGILIQTFEEKTKGKTKYCEPVIEAFTPTNPEKTKQIAEQFYKQLHDYFTAKDNYFEEQTVAQEEIVQNETENVTTNDDDLPF